MQANAANEHSQMLAQVPANACSDSESRKCSLVLLLVTYCTLAVISSLEKQAVDKANTVSRHGERLFKDDEQA